LPESSAEQFDVGFNSRYVLNVTAACTEEIITIHAGHSSNAALFTNMSDQQSAQFVIMPMRV